jgi:hypothetical protein
MKAQAILAMGALAVAVASCATTQASKEPAVVVRPFPAQPEKKPTPLDWQEIDKSTQRTKARALAKPEKAHTVTDKVESGFLPMSEDDYARAKTKAMDEVRKANPKMSESDVESAAVARADQEKREYEQVYRTRASTSYEWKTTGH